MTMQSRHRGCARAGVRDGGGAGSRASAIPMRARARAEPCLRRADDPRRQGLEHRDRRSEVASLGIQVHGGMGFIEETGAAQYCARCADHDDLRGNHRHPGERPHRPQRSCATAGRRWRRDRGVRVRSSAHCARGVGTTKTSQGSVRGVCTPAAMRPWTGSWSLRGDALIVWRLPLNRVLFPLGGASSCALAGIRLVAARSSGGSALIAATKPAAGEGATRSPS